MVHRYLDIDRRRKFMEEKRNSMLPAIFASFMSPNMLPAIFATLYVARNSSRHFCHHTALHAQLPYHSARPATCMDTDFLPPPAAAAAITSLPIHRHHQDLLFDPPIISIFIACSVKDSGGSRLYSEIYRLGVRRLIR